MATTVQWYVDPDATGAGDGTSWEDAYTSLQAFDTAEAKDLKASDEVYIVNCRSSEGSADVGANFFNIWVSDLTNYVQIQCTGTDKHNGVWDETKYRIEAPVTGIAFSSLGNIKVRGLQIWAQNTDSLATSIKCSASNDGITKEYEITDNILRGPTVISSSSSSQGGVLIQGTGTGTSLVANNIVYDFVTNVSDYSTSRGIYSTSANITNDWYNNTVVNCSRCIGHGVGAENTVKAVNNIAQCNQTYTHKGFSGTFISGSDYNLTSESGDDVPGSNSISNSILGFRDLSNDDYYLDTIDTDAIGSGIGPSIDANVPSEDIHGGVRAGPTADIGADEFSFINVGVKVTIEKFRLY